MKRVAPGLLLVIQVICSVIQHVRYPRNRLIALLLLLRLGLHSGDEGNWKVVFEFSRSFKISRVLYMQVVC